MSWLKELKVNMEQMETLPADFLLNAQPFQSCALDTYVHGSNPVVVSGTFRAHPPSLTTLLLCGPRLQELWPAFLFPRPQLERLELEHFHGKSGKEIYALLSFPAHFLVGAAEPTNLNLGRFKAGWNCRRASWPIHSNWNI